MPTLGGSLITRNCIRLDYCFEEAIRSLLPVVDTMVVLDCGSMDGTLERLRELEETPGFGKLFVYEGGDWDCAPDYHRLSILANQARTMGPRDDWHFMIQADEVLHESSYGPIRDAIRERKRPVFVRRLNLFGSVDRMLRLDLPPGSHPCGHEVAAPDRARLERMMEGGTRFWDGHPLARVPIDGNMPKCVKNDPARWFNHLWSKP